MPFNQEKVHDKWKTRAYKVWTLVGLAALIGLALYICGILWQAVATVVITALITFLLHDIVNRLERRGISRVAGSAIVMVIFIAIIVGCIGAFIPALASQASSFASSAPGYARGVRDFVMENLHLLPVDHSVITDLFNQAVVWVQDRAGSMLQSAAGGLLGGIIDFGNAMLVFFIALVCSFWMLVDLPKISREVMSLFSDEQQEDIHIVASAFGTAVYGWAKATLLCAIISGLANGIAYWIMGIPYSAVLGVLCGVLYFVPYIGPIIAAVTVMLVAILASPVIALAALVFNVIVNNVVANIISPKLMKSSVNVHPAIIMIVILIGGALGGMVGMLFSIPIAAAVQGVFITFFEERTGKQLATEDGALFQKPKNKLPRIERDEKTGKLRRIR